MDDIEHILKCNSHPNELHIVDTSLKHTTPMKEIFKLYQQEYNKNRGNFKTEDMIKISHIIFLFLEKGGDYKGYEHFPVVIEFLEREQEIRSIIASNLDHESNNLAQMVMEYRSDSSRDESNSNEELDSFVDFDSD
jgi:hypothetical protein